MENKSKSMKGSTLDMIIKSAIAKAPKDIDTFFFACIIKRKGLAGMDKFVVLQPVLDGYNGQLGPVKEEKKIVLPN